MTRNVLSGWVALSLGVGTFAVRADDAKPPTPGKPQTPARPETPGRPRRGAATNFDALARLTSSVRDLQLTGEKKTKADEILARAKGDLDKAQKEGGDRQAMIGIVRAATEEITALLDEDQRLMFENKLKAAANAPTQGGAGAGAGPGPGAGGPGGNRPLPITQRLNEVISTLNLSDDQKKKVDDLLADVQKKAVEIRSAGNPGPEMREKIQALREDVLKQIKSILNEEQFKKLEEAMRPQPGPGAGGGGARLGALIQRLADGMKDLNLSDDQKPKVQAALADARKKFQELAPQLQGGQPTPELREKFRGILEGLRDELSGVLNEEQKEKFRALMQPGQGAGGQGARKPNAKGEKPADK